MISKFIAMTALTGLLSSCDQKHQGHANILVLEAVTVPALPDEVVIRVQNRSDQFVCIPIAEWTIGGGFMSVQPAGAQTAAENRPPPVKVGGLEVTQGLYVVAPRQKYVVPVDVSYLRGQLPSPTSISGDLRAAFCGELFRSATPNLLMAHFQVDLRRITVTVH